MKTVEEMTIEEQVEHRMKVPLTAIKQCDYEIYKIGNPDKELSKYACHTVEYWTKVKELIIKMKS